MVKCRRVRRELQALPSRCAQPRCRRDCTVAQEAAQEDSYDALAAAHSRALARMSGDIAAAIRAKARKDL